MLGLDTPHGVGERVDRGALVAVKPVILGTRWE
jgi:hypothetical protein